MRKQIILYILFISSLSVSCDAPAQVTPEWEQGIERMTEQAGDAETQDEALIQEISFWADNPVNLNFTDESELLQFRLLSEEQVRSLVNYRRIFGPLVDLFELQAIPGWSVIDIKKILPYVTLQAPPKMIDDMQGLLKGGKHSVLLRYTRNMEKAKGFKTEPGQASPAFLGNPDKWFMRYDYQYKNILQYGVLGEKDPGEPLFSGRHKQGFDFYSFHFYLRNRGRIRCLALGDFTVNMGQGLIEWQGFSFGKGGDLTGIKRQSDLIKPYRSSGEFNFHRGLAINLVQKKWSLTGFASYRKLDANLVGTDSLNSPLTPFTSLISTGLHRTESELSGRGRVRQLAYGMNVKRTWRNGHIGFNLVRYWFSRDLQKADEPYNLYALSGNSWHNLSLDAGFTLRQMHVFGEVAGAKNAGKALLAGCLLSLASQADICLLYRNLSPRYQTVNGSAFTDRSKPGNEKGLYAAMSVRPAYRWEIVAYADRFSFPWLQYGVSAPTAGSEYGVRILYKPGRNDEIYLRFRYLSRQMNEPAMGNPVQAIGERSGVSLRMHASCRLDNRFSVRSRMELSRITFHTNPASIGFLVYTDLFYKPLMSRVSANARLLFAETDDYDSRVYTYENDVLYQVSVPAFYGQVRRVYINVEYNLNKSIGFWIRISRSIYSNKVLIGSGLDEINGNRRTELKLQCLYRF